MPFYVYFIQAAEGTRRIKIGISTDVKNRFASIQACCSETLEMLGIIPGTFDLEKEWHRTFNKFRHHNEWFNPEPELLDAINKTLKLTKSNINDLVISKHFNGEKINDLQNTEKNEDILENNIEESDTVSISKETDELIPSNSDVPIKIPVTQIITMQEIPKTFENNIQKEIIKIASNNPENNKNTSQKNGTLIKNFKRFINEKLINIDIDFEIINSFSPNNLHETFPEITDVDIQFIRNEAEKYKQLYGKYPSAASKKFGNISWGAINHKLICKELSLSRILTGASPKVRELSLQNQIHRFIITLQKRNELPRGDLSKFLLETLFIEENFDILAKYGIYASISFPHLTYKPFPYPKFIRSHN